MIPHQLSTLFKERLQWMQEHHYSDKTVQSHQESFTLFIRWTKKREIQRCNAITADILLAYQQGLKQQKTRQQKPFSVGYQRTLLSTLIQCFRWAFKRGYLLLNPAQHLQLPKAMNKLPIILSVTEMQAILEAPDLNTPYGIRDRALLEVFYATGLRRNEVLKLTPADLDRKSGIVWVNQGKGKKDREVPIAFSTLEWVAHYEEEVREHWISKGKNENQLFLNDRGKPLTRYSCNDRVLQYVRQVAPNKKGSCHLIRHSISTHLLERGCHIRFIQEILGHTSLSSTQRYAQVRIMHLREAYKRYHPSMKKK